MGSLRNPIGPLPSSIYWRRRAVALAVLVLLVLLTVWAVTRLGGDDGARNEGKSGGKGGGPASTITPGPTDPGPAISDRPGGRDEEDGGADGSSSGAGGSGGAGSGQDDDQSSAGGSGWGAATGGSTGSSGDGGASSGGSGSGGSGGGGAAVPAAPSTADCAKSDVELHLRSVRKSYGPDQKPKFKLKAVNKGSSDCKIDLGRTATVVTITNPDDAKFWASDDCPPSKKPLLRRVPADGSATFTLTWYRKASAANCGTSTFEKAKDGTYRIAVDVKGFEPVKTRFTLEG